MLPRDRGIGYAGGIKTAVQTPVLPVRDELIVHLFGQIPVSVWMVLFVTILVPIPVGQVLPVDLYESPYELAILTTTARTPGIVLVPVDLHREKAFQHSSRCREFSFSTGNNRPF